MLVAVASFKGAPMVTTFAVALAARWPTPGAVVVEADPTGGDLAFRFGLRKDPGLADLAMDTRAGGRRRELAAYAQRLPLAVDVVFAPADETHHDVHTPQQSDQVGESVHVVRMVARNCLELLHDAAADRLVVIDVGRLGWDSPAVPLAAAADVLFLLSRPGLDAIDGVQVRRDRLLALPGMRASVRLVLDGKPPCPVPEVAATVGLPVAGVLPQDEQGAAVLAGRARAGRGWTRLELPRAARAIALTLQAEEKQRAADQRARMQAALLGKRGDEAMQASQR